MVTQHFESCIARYRFEVLKHFTWKQQGLRLAKSGQKRPKTTKDHQKTKKSSQKQPERKGQGRPKVAKVWQKKWLKSGQKPSETVRNSNSQLWPKACKSGQTWPKPPEMVKATKSDRSSKLKPKVDQSGP